MGDREGDEDERPPHRVELDPFQIAIHPVTQEQYAEFVHATGHRAPAVRDLPLVVSHESEVTFRDLAGAYIWRGGDPPRDRAQHPVALVTFADASPTVAGSDSASEKPVRLPTEAEWERAARADLDGVAILGVTISTRRARIFSPTRRSSGIAAPVPSAATRPTVSGSAT